MKPDRLIYRPISLRDMGKGGTEEVFEFSKDDVISDDQELIQEGAFFYWSVGYEELNGSRKKTSIIKLKRKVAGLSVDKKKIQEEADKLQSDIIWE